MIATPQPAQRMTSLMLVLLLHALLLMLLLNAFTQKSTRPNAARETILRLLPMFQRAPEEQAAPSSGKAPTARRVIAPAVPPPVSEAPPAPDIRGFGQRLFGCAPEQLATLTPAERARCATGLVHPGRDQLIIPKSRVLDPVRRAAEMKAKNSPLRIPCTYTGAAPGPYFSNTPTGMIDPSCAISGLVNGFDPLTGLPK